MAHVAGGNDGEMQRHLLLLPDTDMDLRPSAENAGDVTFYPEIRADFFRKL